MVKNGAWITPNCNHLVGLCMTAGAYHRVHFDCEGFETFVYLKSRVKIWMIGVPKHGKTFDDLASIDCFLSDKFSLDAANFHLVNWVALSLMPGTMLYVLSFYVAMLHFLIICSIMQPNINCRSRSMKTIHFIQNCIFHP